MLTASRGYGPVAGVLLIAAATVTADPWSGSAVPLATILAACDGDVTTQDGQFFYEGARLAPQQSQWATSVWLERANHNHFNQILGRDPFGTPGRPDCDTILEGETQRRWLTDYAVDFLTTLFAQDPTAVRQAEARMGMDVHAPAPDALHALPARVAGLAPASDRRTIFRPSTAEELTSNLLGGSVTADGVVTHFCPKGFYNPTMLPGSEPCRRTYCDDSRPAISCGGVLGQAGRRAALCRAQGRRRPERLCGAQPACGRRSGLGPQCRRETAGLHRPADRWPRQPRPRVDAPDEPALMFPPGFVEPLFEGESIFFTGLVPLTTIRLALSDFAGVDLTDIREVALEFDRTPSGTLFLGDVEWVR